MCYILYDDLIMHLPVSDGSLSQCCLCVTVLAKLG
jgi:hypothetical protein